MKKIITLLLAFITIAHVPALSEERNRGYGFLMLEEPTTPRNTAMGSTGTALNGPGFRYYNPAQPFFSPTPAPSKPRSPHASAEFGQLPGGVSMGGVETAMHFPTWWSAVSFFSSAVDFVTTDEHGLGAPASSGTTIGALGLGYVRGSAAAAVAITMTEDRLWAENSYSALSISLGLGYKLIDDKLNLGAAWQHAAAQSRGFGENGSIWSGGNVPVFARAGAAWSDTLLSIPYTVAADIVYRDDDGTFSAPVGLEVGVLPYLNLRMGKRIGWESEVVSLGIGIRVDRIAFDAAFVPTVFVDEYEMKWSVGFTYCMGSKRDRVVEKAVSTEESVLTGDGAVSTETEEAGSTEEAVLTDEEAVSTGDDAVSTEESVSTEEPISTETEEPIPTEDEAVSTEE